MSGREMKDLMAKLNEAVDLKEGVVANEFKKAFHKDQLEYDEVTQTIKIGMLWNLDKQTWTLYDENGMDPVDNTPAPDPARLIPFVQVWSNEDGHSREWVIPMNLGMFDEILDNLQAEFERRVGASK